MPRGRNSFFSAGEYRDAFLTAQRTLQVNPGNADATRLIASVLEKNGLYESLIWWKRVAALKTGKPEDAISFAAAALRYRDPATADKALKSISDAQRHSAAYHSMAASVALALNHKEDAFAHYVAALKIAPDNEQLKLDLATAQLRFSDAATQAKARAEVEALLSNKTCACPPCLRWSTMPTSAAMISLPSSSRRNSLPIPRPAFRIRSSD